jgi:hypothetical protein
MIFDVSNELNRKKAIERFKFFLDKKKTFELTEKRPLRTLSQNNYLHLILSWYALEYGETLKHTKLELFKKQLSPDIFKTEFVNKKNGECRDEWKSSANIDTKQMTTAINRFRNYASKQAGIYLPSPDDLIELQDIKNQIENYAEYL